MKFTISTVLVVSASAMLPFASASHPFAGLERSSRRAANDSNKQRTLMEDPSTYDEDGCPLIECDKNHEEYEWGLDGAACHFNCGSDSDCQMPTDDDFSELDAQTWQGWCMKLPPRAQPTRRRLFGGMVESGCPRGKCYDDDEFLPCAKNCGWYEDNRAELHGLFNDERDYLQDQTGYTCSLFSSFHSACGCDADPFSNFLLSGMCDYNSGVCLDPVGPAFCNNDISETGAKSCQDFVRDNWMQEEGEHLADPDKKSTVWDLKITIGCMCPPENEDSDQAQTYCDNSECKQAYIDYYILYYDMTPESALEYSRCPPVP